MPETQCFDIVSFSTLATEHSPIFFRAEKTPLGPLLPLFGSGGDDDKFGVIGSKVRFSETFTWSLPVQQQKKEGPKLAEKIFAHALKFFCILLDCLKFSSPSFGWSF